MPISKKKWKCDSCGKKQKKETLQFNVYDENWNKQKGVYQCQECFKKNCI